MQVMILRDGKGTEAVERTVEWYRRDYANEEPMRDVCLAQIRAFSAMHAEE